MGYYVGGYGLEDIFDRPPGLIIGHAHYRKQAVLDWRLRESLSTWF
jgi:hypothetical protein